MCRWNCPRNGNSDTLHFAFPVAAAYCCCCCCSCSCCCCYCYCLPFLSYLFSWLRVSFSGGREAKGVRTGTGPVISIYNLILSNDNDDDNNSSNFQPATCNNNYSSAAAIKTLPLQSLDKLVLMVPPEPGQTPAATQSRPQSTILVSSLQSAVCNLSRLRFRLQLELGPGLRFSLWLRYCKPRTERQSSWNNFNLVAGKL